MVYRNSQPFEVQFLNSGVPIVNAQITYIGSNGLEQETRTDADGVARLRNVQRTGVIAIVLGEGFEQRGIQVLANSGRTTLNYFPDRTEGTNKTLFGRRIWTWYPHKKEEQKGDTKDLEH